MPFSTKIDSYCIPSFIAEILEPSIHHTSHKFNTHLRYRNRITWCFVCISNVYRLRATCTSIKIISFGLGVSFDSYSIIFIIWCILIIPISIPMIPNPPAMSSNRARLHPSRQPEHRMQIQRIHTTHEKREDVKY